MRKHVLQIAVVLMLAVMVFLDPVHVGTREAIGSTLRGDQLSLTSELILSGLDEPTFVTAPGGDADRLFIVYLDVPLEVLRDRMASGHGDRPSLTGADPIEEAEAVTRDRDPVYRSLADATCSIPAGESMGDSLERLAGMLKEAR